MWKLLKQCKEGREDSIEDIYDGEEYRKHSDFFKSLANISLICNTDGVSIFNSSNVSIWPIWLAINELPPILRFSRQNVLLAGLWYGEQKPPMSIYLKPLIDSVNTLYREG